MDIDDKVLVVNNVEYIVVETVDAENKKYAYLVNAKDETDTIFREVILSGGLRVVPIEKEIFKQKIYPLFIEKFKKY